MHEEMGNAGNALSQAGIGIKSRNHEPAEATDRQEDRTEITKAVGDSDGT